MNIIFSDNKEVKSDYPSIFLAGPSPRSGVGYNWRVEAIQIFSKYKIIENLTLLIPLPSTGIVDNYDNQIEWEEENLERADVIMFWIPRDLDTLPGFTTNFEFGEYYKTGKVVYGRPDDAPKMKYLDYKYSKFNPDKVISNTLEKTIITALKSL